MNEVGYAKAASAPAVGQIGYQPDQAATVSQIIKRSVEVSESIGLAQQQAFGLADRIEVLVNRLVGSEPPVGEGTLAGRPMADKGPREPSAAIDLIFQAIDGLDPQVNALRSPFARISNALDRLDRTLG